MCTSDQFSGLCHLGWSKFGSFFTIGSYEMTNEWLSWPKIGFFFPFLLLNSYDREPVMNKIHQKKMVERK